MSLRRPLHYNAAPRYSGGSPDVVRRETALEVVRDERDGYLRAMSGIMGPEARAKATALGLAGIVEEVREGRRAWIVRDLLTDEEYLRPFTTWKGSGRGILYGTGDPYYAAETFTRGRTFRVLGLTRKEVEDKVVDFEARRLRKVAVGRMIKPRIEWEKERSA